MNTDHIDHEGFISQKHLKKSIINIKQPILESGEWVVILFTLGYDESDGPTKNNDGNFINNKSQWKCLRKIRKIFFRLLIKQLNSLHHVH